MRGICEACGCVVSVDIDGEPRLHACVGAVEIIRASALLESERSAVTIPIRHLAM